MRALASRFVADEDGVDLVEYALLAGLIAFGCILAITAVGTDLSGFFGSVATKLTSIVP